MENDPEPQKLVLTSTLPIICPDTVSAASSKPCELEILITTTGGIAVRQRFEGSGVNPTTRGLRYILKETDWKNTEKLAYNMNSPLEIVAKVSPMRFFIDGYFETACLKLACQINSRWTP